MERSEPQREYEIQNDYSYSTGRARALEAKIRDPESMSPEQVLKEYGLSRENIEPSLEEQMGASLREFKDFAPDAVEPFRLMADLSNLKAFIRNVREEGEIPYSSLGSLKIPKTADEIKAKLIDAGYEELADKFKELLSFKLRDSDLFLENYFTSRIKNQFFLDCLILKKNYLISEEAPKVFYLRLLRFIKERYVIKSMDIDVATGFLLLKERELDLAMAKAVKAFIGE
jgi:hypothetical protein